MTIYWWGCLVKYNLSNTNTHCMWSILYLLWVCKKNVEYYNEYNHFYSVYSFGLSWLETSATHEPMMKGGHAMQRPCLFCGVATTEHGPEPTGLSTHCTSLNDTFFNLVSISRPLLPEIYGRVGKTQAYMFFLRTIIVRANFGSRSSLRGTLDFAKTFGTLCTSPRVCFRVTTWF